MGGGGWVGLGGQGGDDGCQWSLGDTGWFGMVPDLAAAPNGSVMLSYVANDQVQLAQLGGASETVPTSSGAGQRFRKPRLAIGAGAVHLGWGSSSQHLEYARRSGGNWIREQVTTVQALFSVPQIAATPDGAAHIIYQWCETTECPNSATAYWLRSGGGGWSGPELLSEKDAEWRDDALVADQLGRVHGVWKGAFRPGQYRRRSAAGSWEPVQTIAPSSGGNTVSFGDITVGPDDLPHHAFFEFGSLAIGYARGKPNGKWYPAEMLSGPGLDESGDYDMRPGIAISTTGVVTVVWAQYSAQLGGPGPIMVCQGSTNSWQCGQLAADSGVTVGGKPAVAFADGAFTVVWRHLNGSLKQFQISCPHY